MSNNKLPFIISHTHTHTHTEKKRYHGV